MFKYALIAITMSGPQMDERLQSRGYDSLAECQTEAAIAATGDWANKQRHYVCIPDRGAPDDAMFESMK